MGSSCENSALGVTRNPYDLSRVPGGSTRRLGGRGRRTRSGDRFRQRHRRFDSRTRCVLQRRRFQADVRPRFALRFDRLRVESRPDRSAFADGRRCGARVRRDGRLRSDGFDLDRPSGRADRRQPARGSLGVDDRHRPRVRHEGSRRSRSTQLYDRAYHDLQALGAELVEVSLPTADYGLATYYLIAPAECSSNLARFDGVRYGLRVDGADVREMYDNTRAAGFGPEVKRRILIGTHALSSGYYDAYYVRAQKARTLIARDFEKAFADCDLIACPAASSPAFRFNAKSDPYSMYLMDYYTIPMSLAGLPALSVPCGWVTPDGGDVPDADGFATLRAALPGEASARCGARLRNADAARARASPEPRRGAGTWLSTRP